MTDKDVYYSHIEQLFNAIYQLGKDNLKLMSALTQVANPSFPSEHRTRLLSQMFSKVGEIINNHEGIEKLQYSDQDVELDLFLRFCEIKRLLTDIPATLMLNLGVKIPPGSMEHQREFLKSVKDILETWSNDRLRNINATLSTVPVHKMRSKIMELAPHLPPNSYDAILEIVRMDINDLIHFKNTLSDLSDESIFLFVNLLNLDAEQLIDIRKRLTSVKVQEPEDSNLFQIKLDKPKDHFKDLHESYFDFGNSLNESRVKRDRQGVNKSIINLADSSNAIGSFMNESYSDLPFPKQRSLEFSSDLFSSDMIPIDLKLSDYYKKPEEFYDQNNILNDSSNLWPALSTSQQIPITMPSGFIMDTSSPIDNTISNYSPTVQQPQPQPQPQPNYSTSIKLRVVSQPPAKVVYLRLLKPAPAVILINDAQDSVDNLFVEASLIRCDNSEIVPQGVDGNTLMKIGHEVVQFKKMKIMTTTLKCGTEFKLKFQLLRYIGENNFENLGIEVTSNPINVVSHSQYLTNKNNSPLPATVSEILPSSGTAGTKVVILGSNFIQSNNLSVKIGNSVVVPQFHESGTLICIIPKLEQSNQIIPVTVSNDGRDYSHTKASFTYI